MPGGDEHLNCFVSLPVPSSEQMQRAQANESVWMAAYQKELERDADQGQHTNSSPHYDPLFA